MYSSAFCRVYNEFGWNYFPEAFGQQLLEWLKINDVQVKKSLDLGCGTGVLCEALFEKGIEAWGMDLSENMIKIARQRNSQIHYDTANMITYRPEEQFELVTSTGDALNHIIEPADIEKIFRNVFAYMRPGGYFIFDILNENEVADSEPIDLDFSESVKAQFCVTRREDGIINLNVTVYENGKFRFEENISEIVHEPEMICGLLKKCGFEVLQCADQLILGAQGHGNTWFVVAKKPE